MFFGRVLLLDGAVFFFKLTHNPLLFSGGVVLSLIGSFEFI